MNYSANPYFDPNPAWMFTILKIELAVGLIAASVSIYLLLFQTPASKSPTFVKLLLFHVIVGTVFEIHFTVLSPLVFYLPYTAIECPGIWTAIGISLDIQIAEHVHLISAAAGAVCPLFYYRMDILLPPYHVLHNRFLRYTIYGTAYIWCNFILGPCIYMVLNYQDQKTWKTELFDELQIEIPGYWTPGVWIFRMNENPWSLINSIMIMIIVSSSAVIICVSICVIFITVKGATKLISNQSRRHHIRVFWSLMALGVVLLVVFVVDIPFFVYVFWIKSPRCDLMNLIIVLSGSAYPSAVIAYMLSYKPYRVFFKRLLTGQPISSTVNVSVTAAMTRRRLSTQITRRMDNNQVLY